MLPTFNTRDGALFYWDLHKIVEFLVEKLEEVDEIHLFGSRAYSTGSLRSDIDLLVFSQNLVSLGVALSVQNEIPPLDIFRTRDMSFAESTVNGSKIKAHSTHGLLKELNAIPLWTVRDGFNNSFHNWVQKTRVDARFIKSVAEFPVTRDSKIFIGHGHSNEWRKLNEWLNTDLQLETEEFDSAPAAGMSTQQHLEDMLYSARFAFLVATGEDVGHDGRNHARENVIHEIGLFQGRLGFRKAIVLLEEGCSEFTNIRGLIEIRFQRNRLETKFDDLYKVLTREGILRP